MTASELLLIYLRLCADLIDGVVECSMAAHALVARDYASRWFDEDN